MKGTPTQCYCFIVYSTGNPTNYWPLEDHTNMINLRGDLWGTFNGTVGTTRGARLGAVYTSGRDAVINLGEVRDVCFTDPLSCVSGFTVSLWLKQRPISVAQEFVSIGDKNKEEEATFSLFQQDGRMEKHLAVRVSASSRRCVYAFSVPQSLWSHYVFVWNTTQLLIFRNSHMVNEFLNKDELCTEETENSTKLPVVILKGDAVFDDFKIWNRTLQPNEVEEMYSCVKGNTTPVTLRPNKTLFSFPK